MLTSRRSVKSAERLVTGNKIQDTDLVFCYCDGGALVQEQNL